MRTFRRCGVIVHSCMPITHAPVRDYVSDLATAAIIDVEASSSSSSQ